VLDLTPVDELILDLAYSNELSQLGTIVTEAQGLAYDVGQLRVQVSSLFGLETVPRSTGELGVRMAAIRQVVFDSYSYALRTQALLCTVMSTVEHLSRLGSAIGSVLGNMQSQQVLAQTQATMGRTLATLQVQMATFDRAQTVERLTQPMLEQSMDAISEATMADHPRPRP
jgi:conjugal transfer/entry exclusion protein